MIKYTCPHCGCTLESEDGLAGQLDLCPVCHHEQAVPGRTTSRRSIVFWTFLVTVVFLTLILGGVSIVLIRPRFSEAPEGASRSIAARRTNQEHPPRKTVSQLVARNRADTMRWLRKVLDLSLTIPEHYTKRRIMDRVSDLQVRLGEISAAIETIKGIPEAPGVGRRARRIAELQIRQGYIQAAMDTLKQDPDYSDVRGMLFLARCQEEQVGLATALATLDKIDVATCELVTLRKIADFYRRFPSCAERVRAIVRIAMDRSSVATDAEVYVLSRLPALQATSGNLSEAENLWRRAVDVARSAPLPGIEPTKVPRRRVELLLDIARDQRSSGRKTAALATLDVAHIEVTKAVSAASPEDFPYRVPMMELCSVAERFAETGYPLPSRGHNM